MVQSLDNQLLNNLFLISVVQMNPPQFNFAQKEVSKVTNLTTRVPSEMNRSMIIENVTFQNTPHSNRTPRLSQFLTPDSALEETGDNKSMVLASRRNRKYSQHSFNQQLLQNVNRSRLVQSRIVEPLKFCEKEKMKSPKVDQQINKTASGIFRISDQSLQSQHASSNQSHLVFNGGRAEKNYLTSSKLKFKESPKTEPQKNQTARKKSVMDYINIHTQEIIKDHQDRNQHNLIKYKTSIMKPTTKDSLIFRAKHNLTPHSETSTPATSSSFQITKSKKEDAFGSQNMKNFLKKHSAEENLDSQSHFKRMKQLQNKEGSNSDFTTTQSLRSSINRLNKDDFYIGKRLGKGKFGEVFLAKHKDIGFLCAMKIISKKAIVLEKIENQLCAQIKIQLYLSHPNIAALYGVFSDLENIYLLLEPCLQGQLYQKMKREKRIPEKQTSSLIKQVCVAVDYFHSEKIIHRDLKPQNILLSEGIIKICDFGWAAFHNDQFRDTFCGTPLYLSPELLNQSAYNDKIDNWAIGILTYQMLIGRIPFKITTKQELQKILFEEIVFPEFIEISDSAKNFIMMMLERDPEKRAQLENSLNHLFFQN